MKLLPFRSQYKFRFSLRRLMAVVAIYAILLAMFVPTVRLRVDWEKPRLDDLVFTGSLMVAEAGLVYYAVLTAVIAGGVLNSPKRVGNVSTPLFTVRSSRPSLASHCSKRSTRVLVADHR